MEYSLRLRSYATTSLSNCFSVTAFLSFHVQDALLSLVRHPGFELRYRLAFRGQFHMAIRSLRIVPQRMPHETHADFAKDASVEEARIERVSQIVEAKVADARSAKSRLPGGLDRADGFSLE